MSGKKPTVDAELEKLQRETLTLVTLAMFPILVFMYVRLAQREEQDARAEFGDAYTRYEANTPAFFPRSGVKVHA